MNNDEPMAPGEIGRLFAAMSRQLDSVLDELRTIRSEHAAAFNTLDSRFVPRAVLDQQFARIEDNHKAEVKQLSTMMLALEGETSKLSRELQDAEDKREALEKRTEERRQALEERVEERRRQYKMTMVGQFAWPLLVVVAGAFLVGALHL